MIVVLNGYPGVGKLTIGRLLAEKLGGRLLDIHSVYNVAFALTEFKSPKFRETVEKIEAIAHDLILELPEDVPVVLTTVIAGDSDWGDLEWDRLWALGRERPPFCVVHVSCDLDENIKRICSPARDGHRKPRDPEMARRNQEQAKPLAGLDVPNLLLLNTTLLSAEESATRIASWIEELRSKR
ncbi:AAA family ATPase [uncultured Roseibium sp.]|uniref:AAA family ATPase n=1 Tax=uncultured Roseibium sp. TaxID=1936171 RepID=UPI00262E40CD|nr:AAA family ATPase [uncultured Roseibium sp.]